ncbi:MAG: hypothetical protein FWC85_05230, partial [Elusimicrobia bacterium]|nr:hypothetical protein [Elusimicrobiota bacterium]
FNKWNAGLFSSMPIRDIKQVFPIIKKDYWSCFFFEDINVFENSSRIFKLKYRVFKTALEYNFYIAPKLIRVSRNLIKILLFQ